MNAENFLRLGITDKLQQALVDSNIAKPTEIQERLIPAILNGKDVIGQSQTGTGKTFAFLLPIVEKLKLDQEQVQAIITAPTRELANQLYNEVAKLIKPFEGEVSAQLYVGGTDRQKQLDRLKTKQPHIVVGTPGRINDLIQHNALLAYTATTLVVDEADQMLDMGFIEDVDKVAGKMAEQLQMLVFSATIPEKLQPFLKKYMTQPRHVHVQPEALAAKAVKHQLVPVRHKEKLTVLKEVVRNINPYLAIVFVNTKEQADLVADELAKEGLNIERLHGGLPSRERRKVMKKVDDASVQYLVASDLAARGMDIKGVTHVINYEFPADLDFYVHRVGRTARAGADGLAMSLFEKTDEYACGKLASKGIQFTFVEFKDGEWQQVKGPIGSGGFSQKKPATNDKRQSTSSSTSQPQERTGGKAKAKAKKVKPAYKRKARVAQEKKHRRDNKARSRKSK
ncbi:DEAD/DEAH box helicase [Shouchella sp. 1P01AA]|uniref:DEAD/DEAH box helicase n=1 Tax=Shouchella sp. 1P01AA TaxID=3132301 RepID=UPI00399FB6CD